MTALYRHYAKDETLLYVGISCKPITRLKQHEHDSGWAAEIARVEIERFGSRQDALEAERAAIKKERPKHNVVHARGEVRCRVIELKIGRKQFQFASQVELAKFLRSCALNVQRGEMSERDCAYLLRWVKRGWPALWQRTTSHLMRFGHLSDGSVQKVLSCGATQSATHGVAGNEASVC